MFDQPCFFRAAAQASLDSAERPWRIAFTSSSVHGLWAAVAAGLGVTLRTAIGLPPTLKLRRDLPPVPELALSLHVAGRKPAPAVGRLREILVETVAEGLGPTRVKLDAVG